MSRRIRKRGRSTATKEPIAFVCATDPDAVEKFTKTIEDFIVREVNRQRAVRGLPPLKKG